MMLSSEGREAGFGAGAGFALVLVLEDRVRGLAVFSFLVAGGV